MKPCFSFKYGENEFLIENISSAGNTVFNVDERVTVTADVKEYAEFDAVEWVLHFENAGGENSAVFSDIFDCDILLPLEVSKPLQRGYTAKLGDTCVITMGGTREQALFYDRDKCGAVNSALITVILIQKSVRCADLQTPAVAPAMEYCRFLISHQRAADILPQLDGRATGGRNFAWKTKVSV